MISSLLYVQTEQETTCLFPSSVLMQFLLHCWWGCSISHLLFALFKFLLTFCNFCTKSKCVQLPPITKTKQMNKHRAPSLWQPLLLCPVSLLFLQPCFFRSLTALALWSPSLTVLNHMCEVPKQAHEEIIKIKDENPPPLTCNFIIENLIGSYFHLRIYFYYFELNILHWLSYGHGGGSFIVLRCRATKVSQANLFMSYSLCDQLNYGLCPSVLLKLLLPSDTHHTYSSTSITFNFLLPSSLNFFFH